MSVKSIISSLALAVFLASSPSLAADEGDSEDSEDSEDSSQDQESTVDRIIALAETLEGVRENNSDTVVDNAGEIEAAIMSAAAMQNAARHICASNSSVQRSFTSLFYVTPEDLNQARRAAVLLAQIESLDGFFRGYTRGDGRPDTGSMAGTRGVLPAIGAATQLLSALFRNDDKIKALNGTLTDARILATMMISYRVNKNQESGCFGNIPIRFAQDYVGNQTDSSSIMSKLSSLDASYLHFATTIRDTPTEAEKRIVAAYEAFILSLTTTESGTTAIDAVIRGGDLWSSLSRHPDESAILRLSVDKSGGTLLERKNLWTALGAESFAITAGIVVSYRLSKPNGEAISGGTLYCTTAQINFANLHERRGERVPANCLP